MPRSRQKKPTYRRKAVVEATQPAERVTVDQFARFWQVTARTVENWRAAGMPAQVDAGRVSIDVAAGNAWVLAEKLSAQVPVGPEAEERALLARSRRTMLDIDIAERQGQLVPIDYLAEQVEALCLRLRAKLLNLPAKYAPEIVGSSTIPEAQEILTAAVREAMQAMKAVGDEMTEAENAAEAERAADPAVT